MELEEIKKMIPALLIDSLEKEKLSLIQVDGGYTLVPTDNVMLIQEGGVSGFLAKQIYDIKERIDELGTKSKTKR